MGPVRLDGQAGEALVTLSILVVYLAAVAAVVVPWYRFVARQDWTTAYFAGMPGGLSEMVELGEAKGADVPAIVLAHSLRIVLTIGLMAVLFRLVLGYAGGAAGGAVARKALDLTDAAVLVGCAVLGMLLGAKLRNSGPFWQTAQRLLNIADPSPALASCHSVRLVTLPKQTCPRKPGL